MATITGLVRSSGRRIFANLGQSRCLTTSTCHRSGLEKNADGKFPVTMIPGDGVGPELMDCVQTVVQSVGAPISFEILHLSEVQHWNSYPVDEVMKSVTKNGIAIKGSYHIHILYDIQRSC